MQIRYFPILGFLRTFSMVFWGPHRNSLWQKKLCCNLFQVKPYFAWSIMYCHICCLRMAGSITALLCTGNGSKTSGNYNYLITTYITSIYYTYNHYNNELYCPLLTVTAGKSPRETIHYQLPSSIGNNMSVSLNGIFLFHNVCQILGARRGAYIDTKVRVWTWVVVGDGRPCTIHQTMYKNIGGSSDVQAYTIHQIMYNNIGGIVGMRNLT